MGPLYAPNYLQVVPPPCTPPLRFTVNKKWAISRFRCTYSLADPPVTLPAPLCSQLLILRVGKTRTHYRLEASDPSQGVYFIGLIPTRLLAPVAETQNCAMNGSLEDLRRQTRGGNKLVGVRS